MLRLKSMDFLKIILILCSTFSRSFVDCRTSRELKVVLPNGSPLVGRYLTSDSGKGIRAFMGVPYAEPPIGDLRFKDPISKKPWQEDLKAYYSPEFCIQRDPFRRDMEVEGSEDCLYLNLYAPVNASVSGPLPVMVFFHGGGFMCGSGNKEFYGPDYLLDSENIIYIGASFRLGPLGFLSTESEVSWGNWGLKDQVQVLRWIKENIAAFGGDPYLVTIFGESAGGASVTYHMQSKLSQGLFHRGISESGTNLAVWGTVARKGQAAKRARQLAKMMECDHENSNEMIKCLRQVPADKITKAFYDFFEWDTDPMVPFPPVVEGDHENAFITDDPRFHAENHGNAIPWLTGITSEEGAMKSSPLIFNAELTDSIHEQWERALPVSLYYDFLSDEEKADVTKKIDEFYFDSERNITEKTHQNLTNLYTDSWFFSSMNDYLKIRLSQKSAPTYVYLFSHKGSCSFTEIFKGGAESYYGTSHAEELQYLFPIRKDLKYFFNSIPSDEDKMITKLLTKIWINFAYTGDPTPNEDLTKWMKAEKFPLDYMLIGNGMEVNSESSDFMRMQNNLYPERTHFWNSLNERLYKSNQWVEDKNEIE